MSRHYGLFLVLAVGFASVGGCGSPGEDSLRGDAVSKAKLPIVGPGISAEITTQPWGDNPAFGSQVVITNTGTVPTSNWEVDLRFTNSTITSGPWNAVATWSGSVATLRPDSSNPVIYPNGSITVGFNGAWSAKPYTIPTVIAVRRDVGVSGAGGTSTGTGGTSTGGAATGGKSTGGAATGGAPTGGSAMGGNAPGGSAGTGGASATGGVILGSGGIVGTGGTTQTAGASTGGNPSAGGGSTGGGTTGGAVGAGGVVATAGSGATEGGTGTGGSGGVDVGSEEFFIELASNLTPELVTLASYGDGGGLVMSDGVKLVGASIGYANASSLGTGSGTELGVATELQDLYSARDVFVRGSHIHGNLTTAGAFVPSPQQTSMIDGTTREHASLDPIRRLAWTIRFTPDASPVYLEDSEVRSIAPGAFGAVTLSENAHLTLSQPGIYIVNGPLTMERGSVLTVANDENRVELYVRGDFIYRGTIQKAAAKPNFVIGVAGSGDVPIELPFDAILVAPHGSVQLGTTDSGHLGSIYAKSILARANTTITQAPFSPNSLCSRTAPGGGLCAHNCATDSDCASGISCRNGVCGCAFDGSASCGSGEACTTSADCRTGLACGTANGAAFGFPASTNVCWSTSCGMANQDSSQCGRYPTGCNADSDCSGGQVCGAANGAQFQYMATRVCWPATCATDPVQAGCGSIYSGCGLCPGSCTPNCAGKTCGASASDGCGGTCTGYCGNGVAGCKSDTECVSGSVCSPDAAPYYGQAIGQNACWPVQCQKKPQAERDCGQPTSACGTTCPNTSTACNDRQCGPDPLTGQSCGTCRAGQWCTTVGSCAAQSTPTGPNVPLDVAVPTDVGAIPATMEVTQQGQARYRVPLQVPPGVNGLTPNLSLEYMGNFRQGEVGIGWTIGGLSSITRCHKSYADGGPTAIDYSEADPKYCLDGIPLVRVSAAGVGDGAEFRTEYDSLVRIIRRYKFDPNEPISLVGPTNFEVHSPDGRVSYYGSGYSATGNYGSRTASSDATDFNWMGSSQVWALQKTEDQQGNRIEYRYEAHTDGTFAGTHQTNPAHPNEPLYTAWASHPQISQIIYGGNTTTSGNRTISFTRERLWDDATKWDAVRFGWHAGAPFSVDNRVTRISISYEGQELRNYQLQYAAGARSQLTKLFECALGHCKQPTTFAYKHFEVAILPLPTDATATDALEGQSLSAVHSILDADGTGQSDLLLNPVLDPLAPAVCDPVTDAGRFKFASATGLRSHPYSVSTIPNIPNGAFENCFPAAASDLDNDGKTEIYLSSSDATHGSVFYKLRHQSNGSWLSSIEGTDLPYGVDYNGDGTLEQRPNTSLFDIDTDGDGVANQIDFGPTTSSTDVPFLAAYLPAGSNDFELLGVPRPEPPMSAAQSDAFIRESMTVPDSCYVWDVWRCTKWWGPIPIQAFCTQKKFNPGCASRGYSLKYWASSLKVLDVNGDGLKDLVSWDITSSQPGVYGPSLFMSIWYNTGRNQFVRQSVLTGLPAAERDALNGFLNSGVFHQAFAYDINRDGSDELILIDPVGRDVYALGVGGYYQNLQLRVIQPRGSSLSIPQWFTAKSRTLVLDVDSNGVPDVLFGEGAKVAVAYGEMPEHGLLESVTDGNGRTDTLDYVAGSSPLDYTPGSVHRGASKPALMLPPTVHSCTTTASGEGMRIENYSYTDGRVGYYGRGFLGYTEVGKQVMVKDTPTGVSRLIGNERSYYQPDLFYATYPGAQAQTPYMYYQAGRPWKRILNTSGILSGLGSSAHPVNRTITETTTLQPVLSDVYVPMWLPRTNTVVTSEMDTSGTVTDISTVTHIYEFDQYAQPTVLEYVREGTDGTVSETGKTTITYKRTQKYLDRWLLSLVEGRTTVTSNATGSVTRNDELDYYDDGKLYTVTREPEDANLKLETILQYNDRGNLTNAVESANGVTRETDFFYDSAGDLVQYTLNPLLQSSSFAHFRGYGQIAGVQDPNGLVESRRIDAFGREVQRTDANGVTVETSYETPGAEAAFLTSNGREVVMAVRTKGTGLATVVSFYDHYGRYIGNRYSDDDAVVRRSQVYYDVLGRRNAGSHLPFDDDGGSEYLDRAFYDNLGRPTSLSVASDVGTSNHAPLSITYGSPTEVSGIAPAAQAVAVSAMRITFPNNTSVTKLLDAHGRTVAMVDRNGQVLTYSYSPLGQLRYFTDAAGLTIENRYDAYGRMTYSSDPVRGVSTAQYSPMGDTIVRTTPTGPVTEHYDLLGRPFDEVSPEGTTTWTYDSESGAIGRLVEVDGPPTPSAPLGHRVHYGYGAASDSAGNRGMVRKVTSTIGGETFAFDYEYDSLARLKTIQYPAVGGARYSVTQSYSFGGRMLKLVGNAGAADQVLWEMMEIDNLGRKSSERALGVMTTNTSYTTVEGLLKQLTTSEVTTERLRLTYEYDIDDNIKSVAWRESGVASTNSRYYEYDSSGRQTGEYQGIVGSGGVSKGIVVGYVDYLPNGNINSKLDTGTYQYGQWGNLYAVTAVGGNQYTYDNAGRQLTRTGPDVASGHMDLTWTSFDSPNTITLADGTSTRYEYDGLKQKVLEVSDTKRKILVGGLYQRIDDFASGTHHHSMSVLAQGNKVAEVEFDESPSGALSGPTASAVVTDRLGSATLTRLATGEYMVRQYGAYGRSYGAPATPSGEAYAGYVQDDNLGLSWMSSRLYDPTLGRVLAADPIIAPEYGQDGANRYAYVYNRPTALTDPTGLSGVCTALGANCAFDIETVNGYLNPDSSVGDRAGTGTTSSTSPTGGAVTTSEGSSGAESEAGSLFGPATAAGLGAWRQAEMNSFQNRLRTNPLELRHDSTDWTGFSPPTPIQANASVSVDTRSRVGSTASQPPLTVARLMNDTAVVLIENVVESIFGGNSANAVMADSNYGVVDQMSEGRKVLSTALFFGTMGAGAVVSGLGKGAARGALALSTAQKGALLQAGLQPFKNSAFTAAGRALTKHPELVGLTKATLNQTLRSPGAINAAAEGALGGILHSGTAASTTAGRFGQIIDIIAPNGFGARFSAAGDFIGFLSP